FRDYLYIPLGGNRGSEAATYRNLVVVFLMVGLWHGAAWTFVVWGAFHGAMLVLERATGVRRLPDHRLAAPRRLLTFVLVVIAWVPFRSADLGQAADMVRAMFAFDFGATPLDVQIATSHVATAALLIALPVVALPRGFVLGRYLDEGRTRVAEAARFAAAVGAAPVAAIRARVRLTRGIFGELPANVVPTGPEGVGRLGRLATGAASTGAALDRSEQVLLGRHGWLFLGEEFSLACAPEQPHAEVVAGV